MIASRRASDLRKLNRRYPCRFQREDIAYGWLAHGPAARFEFPQLLGRKDFMAGHIARFDRRANRRQAGSAGRTAPYSRNVPRNVPASRDCRRSQPANSCRPNSPPSFGTVSRSRHSGQPGHDSYRERHAWRSASVLHRKESGARSSIGMPDPHPRCQTELRAHPDARYPEHRFSSTMRCSSAIS